MSETSQKDACNFRYVSAKNCRHCAYMPQKKRDNGKFVKFTCQKHTDIKLIYPDMTVCDDFVKGDKYHESYWRERE